jgi:hypothetical protein
MIKIFALITGRKMRSILTAVIVLLPLYAAAETVTLTNGDKVTGVRTIETNGMVYFETEMLGQVAITVGAIADRSNEAIRGVRSPMHTPDSAFFAAPRTYGELFWENAFDFGLNYDSGNMQNFDINSSVRISRNKQWMNELMFQIAFNYRFQNSTDPFFEL